MEPLKVSHKNNRPTIDSGFFIVYNTYILNEETEMRNESNFFTICPEFYEEFLEACGDTAGCTVAELFITMTDMDDMPEHATLAYNLRNADNDGALKMIKRMVDDYIYVVEE